MAARQSLFAEQRYSLVIHQAEKPPPHVILTYLRLMLNYQYGLDILTARKPVEAASLLVEHGHGICCIVLIQDQELSSRNAISALNRRGAIPLILLMPGSLLKSNEMLYRGLKNVSVCAWESAISQTGSSLQQVVSTAFEAQGIGRIPVEAEEIPHDTLQRRVEQRLKHVNTLPTLPEIVLRITRLVRDPQTTIEDLEELLISDPAIVHRLLQVVKSPTFTGPGHEGEWILKDAIVRLGLKQVGAIAQQIKLINSLLKPEDSPFDLRRFWEHSVGSAVIADRLYTKKLLPLQSSIDFDEYWMGALLHDIGKLVLGFFFWDYFEKVMHQMASRAKTSFHREEIRLGGVANHGYLGRFVLLNANADPGLVQVAGTHHDTGAMPSPLVCLVHVANNLFKDWGMGYFPSDQGTYGASVLNTLGITKGEIEGLRSSLGDETVSEIKELVNRCIQS